MGRPATTSKHLPERLTHFGGRYRYRRIDLKKHVYFARDEELAVACAVHVNAAFKVGVKGLSVTDRQQHFMDYDWSTIPPIEQEFIAARFPDLLVSNPKKRSRPPVQKLWPYRVGKNAKYKRSTGIPKSGYQSALPPWAGMLLYNAEKNARRRRIGFQLSQNDLAALLDSAGGYCAVTGIRLCLDSVGQKNIKRPYAPSIDRIDSFSGYAASNCRIVCVAANMAMSQWGEEVLWEMMKALARKQMQSY